MKIDTDTKVRIEALTHLRAAIMHMEAAMALDSTTWDYQDVAELRQARDLVRYLGKTLDL